MEHRAKTKHINADALSRRPPENCLEYQPLAANALHDPAWRRHNPSKRRQRVESQIQPGPCQPLDWSNLQQSDHNIRVVYDMVKGGNLKPTTTALSKHSDEVKTLCSIYESLLVANNGTLYKRKPSTGNQQPFTQIIVPFSERRRIAEELHQGLNGWHPANTLAGQKTVLLARLVKRHPPHGRPLREMCTIQKTTQPKTRKATTHDHERTVGTIKDRHNEPHPPSTSGYKYISMVIDHFTKWIKIFPIKNQAAAMVAHTLVNKVFSTHGMPLQILTDRGANFESDIFRVSVVDSQSIRFEQRHINHLRKGILSDSTQLSI